MCIHWGKALSTPAVPLSRTWTFLTNHAIVLLAIARDPDVRLREIAQQADITERAVQKIVNDLVEAGYLTRTRVGRRSHYGVHAELPLRHRSQQHTELRQLLILLGSGAAAMPGVVDLRAGDPEINGHASEPAGEQASSKGA